jgi:hypothetical protein
MKQIQSIQIWVNGQEKTGSWLGAYIINDNLSDSAQFYWWIAESGSEADQFGATLTSGNLTMNEPDYSVWDSTADINLAAYEWIASKLGLTLI